MHRSDGAAVRLAAVMPQGYPGRAAPIVCPEAMLGMWRFPKYGFIWDSYGVLMGFLWDFYGGLIDFMGFLWCFNGILSGIFRVV